MDCIPPEPKAAVFFGEHIWMLSFVLSSGGSAERHSSEIWSAAGATSGKVVPPGCDAPIAPPMHLEGFQRAQRVYLDRCYAC